MAAIAVNTPLGRGSYDPAATPAYAPSWTDPDLVTEISTDPRGRGYRNADRSFKSAEAIGELLTMPRGSVANTPATKTIPKPFTITDLMAAAPNATKTIPDADLEPIAARCRAADVEGVKDWADVLLARGAMAQAEHDAVVAVVEATENDPSWPASVPGPSDLETLFAVGSIDHRVITGITGVS